MTTESKLQPTIFVVFGAAGDLTWRKLIPALYNLHLAHLLPEKFVVFGVDGKAIGLEEWRQHLRNGVEQFSQQGKVETNAWEDFAGNLEMHPFGDFNDDTNSYTALAKAIEDQEKAWGEPAEQVYYLATPPTLVEAIVRNLGQAHLVRDSRRSRVVVEKPFGRDLASAQALNHSLRKTLDESQIYRIDHYLGKETVQNILAFRFANVFFEPIWDRRYIDHVQITVAEQVGVEHRGEYYDHAGALRDMIQNHLMQILCLIAMEPPVSFDADEIRARKVDVLRAIRPLLVDYLHEYAVRGQYGSGWIQGEQVPAYRGEPGVSPVSTTETFAALKLFIDNWRWQDVPFYLRTGKRMAEKVSQAVIQFRSVPHQFFPATARLDWQPNRIVINIHPNEGVALRFQAKQPGVILQLSDKEMHFRYAEAFQTKPPEAYETLLLDVMRGDATLFMRADQIEYAWAIVDPVLEVWEAQPPVGFPNYPAGSWGPESAEVLIAQDRRSWIEPNSSLGE